MSEQAQAPQAQPITFGFTGFTLDQVNIILAGLRELPYKLTAELIAGITTVAQQQIDAHAAAQAEIVETQDVAPAA